MLILMERPDIYRGKDTLHFSPEVQLRAVLREAARSYVGCDIEPHDPADQKINIEDVDFPDSSFDLIVCHQVLEHVDDFAAMRELRRLLRPNGTAFVSVPIIDAWKETYEDPSIVTKEDRLEHYGQSDHVRYFGADVKDRLAEAGFAVEAYVAVEPAVQKYGLRRGDTIFICT